MCLPTDFKPAGKHSAWRFRKKKKEKKGGGEGREEGGATATKQQRAIFLFHSLTRASPDCSPY